MAFRQIGRQLQRFCGKGKRGGFVLRPARHIVHHTIPDRTPRDCQRKCRIEFNGLHIKIVDRKSVFF